MKTAVAVAGYVGLSNAFKLTLQHEAIVLKITLKNWRN